MKAGKPNARPDGRIVELYGVPPPGFVAARKEIAAALPGAKALKKPSWPLWAVNQLARRDGKVVQAILDAGGELAGAHRAVLAGRADAGRLREASRAHQDALARAERLAEAALEQAGAPAGAGVLRRIRGTLHAASIGSEETRAALAQGILPEELAPPDVLAAAPGSLPEARPARSRPPAARGKRDARAAREANAEVRRQAAVARQRAAEAARTRAREEKVRAQAKAKAAKLESRAAALEEEAAALRDQARRLRTGGS